MRALNLTILSLLWIFIGAQAKSKSRLDIILIHWDNENINGSYIKVKNNPNYDSTYNVTVDSLTSDLTPDLAATKDGRGTLSYQVTVHHEFSGVGVVGLRWPKESTGISVNVTVVETPDPDESVPESLRVKVSVHTAESAPHTAGIYYPRHHQNVNISMIKLDDEWHSVWDSQDGNWLVNVSNPQQVQILEITPISTTIFCFVCKSGLTTELSAYSLTLYTEATTITYSLSGMVPDTLGRIRQDHDEVSEIVSYTLNFNMSKAGDVISHVVSSGPVSSLTGQKASKYNDILTDGPARNDLYLNEVHFPRLNATNDDKDYWIELIGPANQRLSNYCLVISRYTPQDKKTKYSVCLKPDEAAVTSNKGYHIWNISSSKSEMESYLLSKDTTQYAILLYREDQVEYKLLDAFRFIFIAGTETGNQIGGVCVGEVNQFCFKTSSTDCNTLCLNTEVVQGKNTKRGVSRCGIQKDPALKEKGVAMSVWSIQKTTNKAWNSCHRPRAYLHRISIAQSVVTISAMADSVGVTPNISEAQYHLPNMGLTLMFWNKFSAKSIAQIPLDGANLTLDGSVSVSYPLKTMKINLTKSGNPDASLDSSGTITAIGASLSSMASNNVYALALVQHYSFLPPVDITTQKDQVVDAIVYSLPQTALDISVVTTFMDMEKGAEDQGQIRFSKSIAPTLLHQPDNLQRNTDSWKGVATDDKEYALDTIYLAQSAQKYIRINQVGNNRNPFVELRLLDLSDDLQELYKEGVPLQGLCVVVSAFYQTGVHVQSMTYISTDETLAIGGVVKYNLTKFLSPREPFQFNKRDNFVIVFRELNSTRMCTQPFDISNNPVDGSEPRVNKEVLIDYIKISYNATDRSKDGIAMTDQVVAVRCNSNKPYFDAAFSLVSPGSSCPVPHQLYLYKVCHDRIGVATELENPMPFPTDYLYVYKLNAQNKIVYVARGFKYSVLKQQHNVFSTVNTDISTTDINSFGLGWFPSAPPKNNSILTNNTLSVLVFYPKNDLKEAAESRLSKILETAVDHSKASRSVAYFKPSANDLRHCLLGCDRTADLTDIISYQWDSHGKEDGLCADNYTALYEHVRINEINANTPGFTDLGEYIELKGQRNFQYASGLSIAMLEVDNGRVEYKYVIHINGSDKVFDDNGFFILEHNVTSHPLSSQAANHLRFIPNKVGAVVLLWGARLVPGIEDSSPLTEEHVMLPDFFLDVVVYANGEASARSKAATTLRSMFALAGSGRAIEGQVAIEKSVHPNASETISRCFCDDPWNMDCFEMSFNETKRKNNLCLTSFRIKLEFCVKLDDQSKFAETYDKVRTSIRKLIIDSPSCQQTSCLFSKYQVLGNMECTPDEFAGTDKQLWKLYVGFPSASQKNRFTSVVTSKKLGELIPLVDCDGAQCPQPSTESVASQTPPTKKKHNAAMTAGIVISVLSLIALIIIIIIIVRKRQKYLRNMSARFEANNQGDDDDDTFLPDGRISFSNHWYNQTNGAASNGNTKKDYRKLSQT